MTDHRNLILILEDSVNRLALMREALETSEIGIRSFDNVWSMRRELEQVLAQACVISLDFDLSNSLVRHPGDGMDAVQMLNRQRPVCPVIVHTSLPEGGREMAQALRGGGWRVEQVIFNHREAVADWRTAVDTLTTRSNPDQWICGKATSTPSFGLG